MLASTVWPLADVEGHWDDLELRAWVRSGRKRRLYQEAKLGSLLALDTLLSGLRRRVGRALDGVVLLSGTVPTVDGQVVYGDAYELELADPSLGRAIRTQYAVRVLERDPADRPFARPARVARDGRAMTMTIEHKQVRANGITFHVATSGRPMGRRCCACTDFPRGG